MTITNSNSRIAYTGNGVTVAFSFPYAFDSQDDLVVLLAVTTTGVETVQAITTHYTISGTVDSLGRYPTGGTITFVTAPPSTVSATIYRDPEALQELDLPGNGLLPVEPLEAELDYLTMLAQRTRDLTDRSVRLSEGETSTDAKTVLPFDRASKYLAFGSGKELVAVDAATASGTSVLATGSTTARLLADRAADWINVLDYGVTNGGVDSTTAMEALAASLVGGEILLFPPGTYQFVRTIQITKDHVLLYGGGQNQAVIDFQPTAINQPCFYFSKGYNNGTAPVIMVGSGCYGFKFISQSNVQAGKVAIKIDVLEEGNFVDIRVRFWTGNDTAANPCMGIHHFGWQSNVFKDLFINAELPIRCSKNPGSFLDLDHCQFTNLYLIPATTKPCILFDSGIFVSNVAFNGYQAWVQGAEGFKWNCTSPANSNKTITNVVDNGAGLIRVTAVGHGRITGDTVTIHGVAGAIQAIGTWVITVITVDTFDLQGSVFSSAYTSGGTSYYGQGKSYQLSFENVRRESGNDAATYCIDITSANAGLQTFSIVNSNLNSAQKGIRIGSTAVFHPVLKNIQFAAGALEVFNFIALTGQTLTMEACSFQSSNTVVMTGLKEVFSTGLMTNGLVLPPTASYIFDSAVLRSHMKIANVYHQAFSGTLADDATLSLQLGTGHTYVVGTVTASMAGAAAFTITNCANNGAGLIRVTAAAHGFATSSSVFIASVTGTTEANGTWVVTNIDASNFDLQASAFANAYISGGTAWGIGEGIVACAAANAAVYKIGGTTKTAVADTDVNLCVYRSGASILLKNRLGYSAKYVVSVDGAQ